MKTGEQTNCARAVLSARLLRGTRRKCNQAAQHLVQYYSARSTDGLTEAQRGSATRRKSHPRQAYSHTFHLKGEKKKTFQKEFHHTDQSQWKDSDKLSWF